MRKLILLLLPILASTALGAPPPIFPKEFSAVPVPTKAGSSFKIFIRPLQMRIEGSMGFLSLVSIYDRSKAQYLTLFPSNRTYAEAKATSADVMVRAELARYATGPDGNPCSYKKNVTCTKRVEEGIVGRVADKWEGVFTDGKSGTYWVDKELMLIVRAEDPSFSFRIKDIKIGPQPGELFTIPAGYTPKK